MTLRRWIIIALAVAAVAVGIVVYREFDPAASIFFPRCPVKVVTGLDCPGCGSQRCLHALLHGRWAEAWHYNALLLLMTPVLALMAVAEFGRNRWPRLQRIMTSAGLLLTIIILMVLWTIYRNL